MTKSKLNSKLLLLIYLLVTIGLAIFNFAKVSEYGRLVSQVDSMRQEFKAKQDLKKKAQEASVNLFRTKLDTKRFEDNIVDFLGRRKPAEVSVDDLLTDDVTTVITPYDEFHWHGVKIFTTENERMEVNLKISHLILKPKTNRLPKGGKSLGEYNFVLKIRPNVWNVFGFPVTFHNRDPIPVTSIIDGSPNVEGELPAWHGSGGSSGGEILFVGRPEADGNATWFEKKPYVMIYLRESKPDSTEYLQLDVAFSKSE